MSKSKFNTLSEKLSDKEIMALYKTNQKAGNDAAIKQYTNYIYKIIWNFENTQMLLNEMDDLYQAGCIGLLKALKNYNSKKGTFYNYCYSFIKGEVSQQITFLSGESSKYYANLHRKVINARNAIKKENANNAVTVDEIAERTGISKKLVKRELQIDYTKVSYESLGDNIQ